MLAKVYELHMILNFKRLTDSVELGTMKGYIWKEAKFRICEENSHCEVIEYTHVAMEHLHSLLSLLDGAHGDKPKSVALVCFRDVNDLYIHRIEAVF